MFPQPQHARPVRFDRVLLYFYGLPYFNQDMALTKNANITERAKVQLQVEALNVWNHPMFSTPDLGINSQTFGTISGMQTGARICSSVRRSCSERPGAAGAHRVTNVKTPAADPNSVPRPRAASHKPRMRNGVPRATE